MTLQEASKRLVAAGARRYAIRHLLCTMGVSGFEVESYEISVCNSHVSRTDLAEAVGAALEIIKLVRADNERLGTHGYCL